MKLFTSIITTVVITGAVWGSVFFQPVMENKPSANTSVNKAAADQNEKYYVQSVVSKTVSLDNVTALWTEFETKIVKRTDLPEGLDRFVVVYEDIHDNFTHAKVTIGFRIEQHSPKNGDVDMSSFALGEFLLSRGKHSKVDLALAWEDIDFHRPVKALVETHFLNELGLQDTSQLVVHYQL